MDHKPKVGLNAAAVIVRNDELNEELYDKVREDSYDKRKKKQKKIRKAEADDVIDGVIEAMVNEALM